MSTPKKRKGTPFKIEVTKPERTFVLFSYGEKDFMTFEAEDVSPNQIVPALEVIETNPIASTALLFRELLGEDQYLEFTKLHIPVTPYTQLIEIAWAHASGTLVDVEDEAEGKA